MRVLNYKMFRQYKLSSFPLKYYFRQLTTAEDLWLQQ